MKERSKYAFPLVKKPNGEYDCIRISYTNESELLDYIPPSGCTLTRIIK